MKYLTITLAALGAFAWTGIDANVADAAHPVCSSSGRGVHIGGRNFHIDIGRPHGYSTYRAPVVRSYHPRHRVAARPHLDWHDTSHWDWHPTAHIRHGNHYDVIPAHWNFHREGHWDVRRGGRHRRHW